MARRDAKFADLLEQFVCVRLVQCYGLDRDLFQFDSNLTMAIFFMDADGTLYGRYGTRAGKNDAEFVHPDGLRASMLGALAMHRMAAVAGGRFQQKFAEKQHRDSPWEKYEQIPLMRGRVAPAAKDSHKCYHCHWIQGAEILSRRAEGRKVEDRHLWAFPVLDVLGASLDPRTKATVEDVVEESPAGQAGLQAGDEIIELAGQPILSAADVQWVLHRAPDRGSLSVAVQRLGGGEARLTLELPKDWRRRGDISWRAIQWMLRDEALGFHMEALGKDAQKAHPELPQDRTLYRVTRLAPKWYEKANHAAEKAGLRKGDIITAVNDRPPPATMSLFLAWIAQ